MSGAGDANGSKPLKGMKFVLIGKTEKPREDVAREITEMGGKVVTKVDKKTAACISSKGILISNVVKKVCFYIAQYPVRWTALSALHFTHGRPAHSGTNSTSQGSILATQQLRAKTIHSHFHLPSIARYSFIQLSELGRQWRERKCPNFETVAKGDSNPGSLDCESGMLPLSYSTMYSHEHFLYVNAGSSFSLACPVISVAVDLLTPCCSVCYVVSTAQLSRLSYSHLLSTSGLAMLFFLPVFLHLALSFSISVHLPPSSRRRTVRVVFWLPRWTLSLLLFPQCCAC